MTRTAREFKDAKEMIKWNINDAAEALVNASRMMDMKGVQKYHDQIESLWQLNREIDQAIIAEIGNTAEGRKLIGMAIIQ